MMRIRRICAVMIGLALILSGAVGAGSEVSDQAGHSEKEKPHQALGAEEKKNGEELYDTAKELNDAAENRCVGVALPYHFKGRTPDSQYLFVVAHLASKNRTVQKAAVDILQRLYKRGVKIRASAFDRYLNSEWSVDVRVVAFAYHAQGYPDPHPDPEIWRSAPLSYPIYDVKTYKEMWQENSEIYTEIVNEVVAQPICHPQLALALSACYKSLYAEGTFASIIEKDQHRLLIRRMLLLMSKGAENEGRTDWLRGEIKCLLESFDRDLLDEELASWYRMEPDPEVRKKLFDRFASRWGPGGKGTQPGLIGLLEVAAQEEDEYLADSAKNYLRIARYALEKQEDAKKEE